MTHEPECFAIFPRSQGNEISCSICDSLRAAYRRGRDDAADAVAVYADAEGIGLKSWDVAIAAARGGEQK